MVGVMVAKIFHFSVHIYVFNEGLMETTRFSISNNNPEVLKHIGAFA